MTGSHCIVYQEPAWRGSGHRTSSDCLYLDHARSSCNTESTYSTLPVVKTRGTKLCLTLFALLLGRRVQGSQVGI